MSNTTAILKYHTACGCEGYLIFPSESEEEVRAMEGRTCEGMRALEGITCDDAIPCPLAKEDQSCIFRMYNVGDIEYYNGMEEAKRHLVELI